MKDRAATELISETRDDENRSATARIGKLLLRMAGTERTRGFVERTVNDALGRAEHRRWSDVLDAIGEQSVVNWLIEAARSPRATALAAEAASKGATTLLDKPIGRPGRFMPADASVRLATFAGPALWQWMETQLPRLVVQLDIQAMVERKVLGFISTARIAEGPKAVIHFRHSAGAARRRLVYCRSLGTPFRRTSRKYSRREFSRGLAVCGSPS